MNKLMKPEGYIPALSVYETQTAIGEIKRTFEDLLSQTLNLKRVSAPLFVEPDTGLNDDLNGIERPVEFEIPSANREVQIVHSLAKWKRMALYKYGFPIGEGLYTDMNAVRRDEILDNLHSAYVDQWDWEKVIDLPSRNMFTLKSAVSLIVDAVCHTQKVIQKHFPLLHTTLSPDVCFVTSQELEDQYPNLTPKEREDLYVKEHKTVCVLQIGDLLRSGIPHDGRAPDYDDWQLNGDILFYCEALDCALEVSSMGIRVDAASLDAQLKKSGCEHRSCLLFHHLLLDNQLPLTMGGGIGQSRLCMLLLEKVHIGEVQVSVWDADMLNECAVAGISLL